MRLMDVTVPRIELCGVALDVVTDHPALARYLERHFSNLQRAGAAAGDPDVSVRVRWTEGPRDSVRPETVFPGWQADTMIHRDVHVGPNRVMWLRVDDVASLAIASEHGGRTRRFELCFHFGLGSRGWRERLKRAVYRRKLPALRRSRLSTLTYYAVYYPAWWQRESRGAGHPLHAAGGAIREGGPPLSRARRDPRHGRAGGAGPGARARGAARAAPRGCPVLRARGPRRGTSGGGRPAARSRHPRAAGGEVRAD